MTTGPQGSSASKRIMVVDDSRLVRMSIKQGLAPYGFEVIEAHDGIDAIEKLQTIPNIQLITLDLSMPNLNGFEVLEHLQKPEIRAHLIAMKNDHIPVVIITADDTEADRLQGYKLGAADFVKKNEVNSKLLVVIKKMLLPSEELDDLTVLVADDSDTARAIIVSCLKQIGVNIIAVNDGSKAFNILAEKPESIDLVLTDLHMTTMNGDLLCMKIRNDLQLKDLPVIILSGTSQQQSAIELFRIGITDYLRKPFIKEELIARLMAHLQQQKLNRILKKSISKLKSMSEEKDQFLAVCSHDLRTPVTGILGFSELLLESNNLDDDNLEMIQHIKTSGAFLLELINDILDLGRMESTRKDIEMAPLPAQEILKDTVASLRHTAKAKKIALNLNIEPDIVIVKGNRHSLARVFNNLLSNAIKFTPANGQVTISAECTSAHTIEISFKDTGMGIPADMIPRLFDRYTKISRTGTSGEKGTGLGLTITQELIRAHKGSIKVTSEENAGTTFIVKLPILQINRQPLSAPKIATKTETPDDHHPQIQSLRILLAEDNKVNTILLTRILTNALHRVTTAENGRKAVELFEERLATDPFDLILMDIEMPEMGGVEATQKIRLIEEKLSSSATTPRYYNYPGKQLTHIPIIALTAHTDDSQFKEFRAAGMDDISHKPIKKEKLIELLDRFKSIDSQE